MSVLADWAEPHLELMPVKYRFFNQYWGELFIECRDTEHMQWCITTGSGVLSKKLKLFILEKSPSSRTDADLKDTRFASTYLAQKFFIENQEKIERANFRHPKTTFKEPTYGRRRG